MMKIPSPLFGPLFCLTAVALAKAEPVDLASPDGRLHLKFSVTAKGSPAYEVDLEGKPLIVESKLGLALKADTEFNSFDIVKEEVASHDGKWQTVVGEQKEITDHYNQVTVSLKERAAPNRDLQIVFRAYDEGVSFRYVLPKQAAMDNVVISGESSEFRFPEDDFCYVTYPAQGEYARMPLSKVEDGAERPFTVEAGPAGVVSLAEAGLIDFSRMKFKPLADKGTGVCASLGGPVEAALPLFSPWRVIMSAPTPAKLLQNNFIMLNLNEPCAIEDTSWIKPGTVFRDLSLTTEGAKHTVDYCADHNIAYMIFDAGWYGPENSPESDSTKVGPDPARSKGPLDLKEILHYSEGKKVGIILYVNYISFSRQLDEILPLYRKWGVKGVKYGYVKVGDQESTAFMSKAIRMAAENHLMADIHDEWRPTGIQRTWPNLMTAEGIAGDEEGQHRTNSQSITHLFTRFLAGPADNTICYLDPRVDKMTNHAYQLAKSVCFYSPWQFLYWYDRPPAAAGNPIPQGSAVGGALGDEPEMGFFDRLPTAWDDKRVIDGAIGKFAVIARRKGEGWRVGCMNAEVPRKVQFKLDFLAPGRSYDAAIYSNDLAVPTRTHVKIDHRRVDAGSELTIDLGKNDGQAMEITPVN